MMLKKPQERLAWLPFVLLVALAIAITPVQAEDQVTRAQSGTGQPSSVMAEASGTSGIAVHYAKRYHGKRTHAGKVHNQRHMTAAHPTLPLGTRVKVINLANNRSVVVTVNDRCRKRDIEVIDVSRAAARKLGFLGKGTARVQIISMEEE